MGLLINLFLSIFLVIGAYISYATKNEEKMETISISIGFGTMVTLVAIELIPEALECLNNINLFLALIIFGVLLLKWLDKFVPEHDHHHGFEHDCSEDNVKHIGIVSSIALIIHNLVEGMSVYAVSSSDLKTGLLMVISIGLHNIVMGMVIYSTIKHEKKNKKLLILSLTAVSTFIGALIMKVIWFVITDLLIGVLLAFATGMMVYIVLFELLPHILHNKQKPLCLMYIIIGILVVVVSSLI